jgi:flavin reductase (DIM6/NTAB) family NADH-FMN oxidoreductase RutF
MITRKKPWNRINSPVYSICSRDGDQFNMNIATYITAVSMKPKRYLCAIYKDTKTLEQMKNNKGFVLQLLASTQYRLVDLLGKQSGFSTDKIARLHKRKLLSNWKGYLILSGSLALLHLQILQQFDAGDHVCFLCDVAAYKNNADGEPLTLDILREKKLIRM